MARGVNIGTSSWIPASGFSVNFQRNPIAETSMGLGAEVKLYDGALLASGSIDAPFRMGNSIIQARIENILKVMTGAESSITATPILMSDTYTGSSISVATALINSFEISADAQSYAKVNFGFIGKSAATSASTVTPGTEDANVSVFYNTTALIGGIAVNTMSFSLKGEIPIDQDDYTLNSQYLCDLRQGGNGTLSGSLSMAPRAWSQFLDSYTITEASGKQRGEIDGALTLNFGPDHSLVIDKCVYSDSSASVQGRNRFEKTINFRCMMNGDDGYTYT